MGAGQSGPRVITVQTEEGETDVTVSQDFINYITNESNDDNANGGSSAGSDDYHDELPRAEDVLSGGHLFDRKWARLYEEERLKNEEYKTVTDKEFGVAATSVKNQFIQSKMGQLMPVCEDHKNNVINCYRNNSKETLRCSQEVAEYAKCVEKARKGMLVKTLPSSSE